MCAQRKKKKADAPRHFSRRLNASRRQLAADYLPMAIKMAKARADGYPDWLRKLIGTEVYGAALEAACYMANVHDPKRGARSTCLFQQVMKCMGSLVRKTLSQCGGKPNQLNHATRTLTNTWTDVATETEGPFPIAVPEFNGHFVSERGVEWYIARIPKPKIRRILRMYFVQGMTYREIGFRLDMNVEVVRTLALEGLRRLKNDEEVQREYVASFGSIPANR